MEIILEGKNIRKEFNHKEILKGISFPVYKGELMSIIGPSGCGKTTLLRILIGLENMDNGQIFLEGKDISISFTQRYKMQQSRGR